MADFLKQLISTINAFNLFDWLILVIWLVSTGYGITRGLAREVLSILGWISAFFLANLLAESVSDLARNLIDEPATRYLSAWLITFIAVLMIYGIVAAFLSSQMRQPGFNMGNRLLGGIFGLLRGVIIAAAVSILLRAVLPDEDEGLLDSAVLMQPTEWVVEWIGANFEWVSESESTEVVTDTIDSNAIL